MPIEVMIFDKAYKFECSAEEAANLNHAAKTLDDKFRESRLAHPRLETERVTGMVAFNLSLDYAKLKQEYQALQQRYAAEQREGKQVIANMQHALTQALQSS